MTCSMSVKHIRTCRYCQIINSVAWFLKQHFAVRRLRLIEIIGEGDSLSERVVAPKPAARSHRPENPQTKKWYKLCLPTPPHNHTLITKMTEWSLLIAETCTPFWEALDFNKSLEQHQNHGGLASSRWQEKAPITAALSFLLFNVNSRWQDLQEVQGWEWDATL